MFKKVVSLWSLIVILFFTSGLYGSSNIIKVSDVNQRIELMGVSILPPQDKGWQYHKIHNGKIILNKMGFEAGETYSGMVVLSKLPNLNSEYDFLKLFRKQRKIEPSNSRYIDLLNEEKLVQNDKTMEINFHKKYKDFESKNLPSNVKYLIVEDYGASFQHPFDKNIAVTISLSQRTQEKYSNNQFKNLVNEFIRNIRFKPILRKTKITKEMNKQFQKGLNAYDQKDYKTASKYWKKLVEKGHAVAQNNLGTMYAYGLGVLKDYKQAVKLYILSSEQGYHHGQLNLGASYESGKGILKDYKKALKWYSLSAKQGNSQAQFNLGLLYIEGKGTTQKPEIAYYWWKKAASSGNNWAKKNLVRLCKLSPTVCKS